MVSRLGTERILGNQTVRWLVQRSDSLYLWHWLLLIVAAQAGLGRVLDIGKWPMKAPLIAIAVGLSMATYRAVENPCSIVEPVLVPVHCPRTRTDRADPRTVTLAIWATSVG